LYDVIVGVLFFCFLRRGGEGGVRGFWERGGGGEKRGTSCKGLKRRCMVGEVIIGVKVFNRVFFSLSVLHSVWVMFPGVGGTVSF